MANRSYLYSIDEPLHEGNTAPVIKGLHEWKYDFPLSHLLLASGDPKCCRSALCIEEGPFAIVGEYEKGLKRFTSFLERLDKIGLKKNGGRGERTDGSELRSDIVDSLEFLNSPRNRQTYILLEGAELFSMSDEPFEVQTENLLNRILAIDSEIESFLEKASEFHEKKQISNLKRHYQSIGFGGWSSVLYYSFPQKPPPTTCPPELIERLRSSKFVTLPFVPLRDPGTLAIGDSRTWWVGRERSIATVLEAWRGQRLLAFGTQLDPRTPHIVSIEQLHELGGVAYIDDLEIRDDRPLKVTVSIILMAQVTKLNLTELSFEAEITILD